MDYPPPSIITDFSIPRFANQFQVLCKAKEYFWLDPGILSANSEIMNMFMINNEIFSEKTGVIDIDIEPVIFQIIADLLYTPIDFFNKLDAGILRKDTLEPLLSAIDCYKFSNTKQLLDEIGFAKIISRPHVGADRISHLNTLEECVLIFDKYKFYNTLREIFKIPHFFYKLWPDALCDTFLQKLSKETLIVLVQVRTQSVK